MFFSIGLEIGPELVGEGVFGVYLGQRTCGVGFLGGFGAVFGMEDGGETGSVDGELEIGKIEAGGLAKANEENALAVLGDEMSGIDDAGLDAVAEFLPEGVADDTEGIALIVADEVLDVLQKEGLGALCGDDAGYIEKESPLGGALEAVGAPESVFLADAGEGEGLAGEAADENIMVGDRVGVDLGDIADEGIFFEAVVSDVGFFCVGVPLAGENAGTASLFKPGPHASDSGEEVNEGKGAGFTASSGGGIYDVPQSGGDHLRTFGFAVFPAGDCARANVQTTRKVLLGHTFAGL